MFFAGYHLRPCRRRPRVRNTKRSCRRLRFNLLPHPSNQRRIESKSRCKRRIHGWTLPQSKSVRPTILTFRPISGCLTSTRSLAIFGQVSYLSHDLWFRAMIRPIHCKRWLQSTRWHRLRRCNRPRRRRTRVKVKS